MSNSTQRFGVPVHRDLTKDRVFCRFGRRIESVVLCNNSAATVVVELAAFNTSFYAPLYGGGGHGNRQEVHAPAYFYVAVSAPALGPGYAVVPPFFARRGLVIKKNVGGTWATVVMHGIEEGDVERNKA